MRTEQVTTMENWGSKQVMLTSEYKLLTTCPICQEKKACLFHSKAILSNVLPLSIMLSWLELLGAPFPDQYSIALTLSYLVSHFKVLPSIKCLILSKLFLRAAEIAFDLKILLTISIDLWTLPRLCLSCQGNTRENERDRALLACSMYHSQGGRFHPSQQVK